jgi:hypothetical protein
MGKNPRHPTKLYKQKQETSTEEDTQGVTTQAHHQQKLS